MKSLHFKFTPKVLFFCLLGLWIVIKGLSACYSELIPDEAYYFLFSQHLAWGYFDHPPMVALFIKLGSFIHNELGVRLMAVITQPLVLVILWKIIDIKEYTFKDVLLFFGISASITMFQVYGFIMTPDVPLLLFSALFLLLYKQFLEKESWLSAILLGITMVCLLYSKYQAVLLILLVLLSNLKLLKNSKIWTSFAIAFLLFIPHLYWQYQNGFPSVVYHLIDRSKGFAPFSLIEYWFNQLIVFNPILFILSMMMLFTFKTETLFDRALKFIIAGFIIFFFFSAFKSHVEPQWTVVAALPIIILMFKYAKINVNLKKTLTYATFPLILVIFLINIEFITPIFNIPNGYRGYQKMAREIAAKVGDRPVVFQNGYQNVSEYNFYTQKETSVLNNFYYRQTQYNLLHIEDQFYDCPVFLQVLKKEKGTDSVKIGKKMLYFTEVQHFVPLSNLKIEYQMDKTDFSVEERVTMPITICNSAPFDVDFNHDEFPVTCFVIYQHQNKKWYSHCKFEEPIEVIKSGEMKRATISFTIDNKDFNMFYLGLAFATPYTLPGFNSNLVKCKLVKER